MSTSRLRFSASGLAGAAAMLWSAWGASQVAPATEAEPRITLALEAPAECAERARLDAELDRLLGEAARRGSPLTARVRIDRPGERYRLRLELTQRGRSSERTLDGASCGTLLEAAALLIEIAHDPSAVVERRAAAPPEPAPPPVAPVAPLPAPPAAPPPPPPASPPAGPRWAWTTPAPAGPPDESMLGFALRAGPLFGVGDLPDPHAGAAIGAGLRLGAYRVEGSFEVGAGSTGTADARPGAGADFVRLAGVLRGCRALAPLDGGRWPRGPLELDLSACLGLELGALSGEGFGVASPERGSALWAAPRLDLRLGLGAVGPLGVVADLGLAVPLDPRRYVLRGGTDASVLVVHEPAILAGRAGLSAELEL